MKPMYLLAVAALAAAAACSQTAFGPPQIVVDRTACSHCGMLISERAYAAAYRAPGQEPRVFDDIGCLLDAARRESGALRFWFHDAGDGTWIDGPAATFVLSPEIRTPMGGGFIAFRDATAAEQAAHQHHGTRIGSLTELLAHKRGRP